MNLNAWADSLSFSGIKNLIGRMPEYESGGPIPSSLRCFHVKDKQLHLYLTIIEICIFHQQFYTSITIVFYYMFLY